jgi:hypothetical protein
MSNDDDDLKEIKQDQKFISSYEKLKHKIERACFQTKKRELRLKKERLAFKETR